MRHKTATSNGDQAFVDQELKNMAYSRLIKNTQRQLSSPDQVMSKIIHQPVLEATSEFLGKTIARPSALIGAGFLSLAGSLAYFLLAQHYGYNYNFSVFLVLTVAGFLLGLILEVVWKVLRRFIFRRK